MVKYDDIVAFIPAAGLGTRLKPLTNNKPKALVQFGGKTMLERVLDTLSKVGIQRFCVNIHHFAELMENEIFRLQSKYDIIISDESDALLDTGGGLVRAAGLMNDAKTILVHNVDIFAQIEYNSLINYHLKSGSNITMAVSVRDTSRKLLFKDKQLRGWKNFKTGEIIGEYDPEDDNYLAFSGIHLVEMTAINNYAPKENKFPMIPWYVNNCGNLKISNWNHLAENWFDLGTPERIQRAEKQLRNNS
jgi:MurNAc alpha-1-phosphate uridylyltransferase